MAIENPVSMPEDDLRSTLEAAWDNAPEVEIEEPIEARIAADVAAKAPEKFPSETETPEAKADRARDEQGRFAKKEAEATSKLAENIKGANEVAGKLGAIQPPAGTVAPAQGPSGPPPGWSIAAKAEFDKLPQPVKEAIVSRETEINRGFAKLTEYKGLDPYVETARQAGTSLPQALDRYMAAEELLSRDFVSGIKSLCQMYNVHPAGLAQVLGGQQQGGQQPQQQNPLAPVFQQMSALQAELANIRQERTQSEQEAVNGQLASFSGDPAHKYFENVRVTMGHLLQSGQARDLKDAYETACWMNPEIRALQIKEAAAPNQAQRMQAVNQARRASGSIPLGSPIPGAQANGKSEPQSIRDALYESWDAAGGAI